jgi:hypothetical protein
LGVDLGGEERRVVADPGRLLHVVRDDHDGVARQFVHQVLDLRGGDRVQRGARLVHQDHVGLDGDRAGDAQPLLLAAGQGQPAHLELVLDLVPERGAAQGLLHHVADVALDLVDPDAVGDVVEDGLRERVRLLEHHADPAAHLDGVDVRPRTGPAVVGDPPAPARRASRSFIRFSSAAPCSCRSPTARSSR